MAANQPPWPREWLMTDERIGDGLWRAIEALPVGSAGLVFRHYSLASEERAFLGQRVSDVCRERGLTLAIGHDGALARSLKAQLVHNPTGDPDDRPVSRSAHSFSEAEQAWNAGASLVFLSPIFATRSHPGRKPLGRDDARHIIAASPIPVIALGGMNRSRFSEVEQDGYYGWAGIDAWLSDQVRT